MFLDKLNVEPWTVELYKTSVVKNSLLTKTFHGYGGTKYRVSGYQIYVHSKSI